MFIYGMYWIFCIYFRNKILLKNAFPTFLIIFNNLLEIWGKPYKISLYYNLQPKVVVTT